MTREFKQVSWNDEITSRVLDLLRLYRVEDLGAAGDITSRSVVPVDRKGKVAYVARSPGVIAGVQVLELTARALEVDVRFELNIDDGARVEQGTVVATAAGRSIDLLMVERPSLNLLSHLSGIATATAELNSLIQGTRAKLYDTRKTLPGYRLLHKYAVRCGGGHNHRSGLYDAILIKDNHLALAGEATPISPADSIRRAREFVKRELLPPETIIEVEVDSLAQFYSACEERPDLILLDNFRLDDLRTAVGFRDLNLLPVMLEASGGINKTTIVDIAKTGVDRISVGALTHSVKELDIGVDWMNHSARR